MSPFFVPSGDLDVPEGFSKKGDTLDFSNYIAAQIGANHQSIGRGGLLERPKLIGKKMINAGSSVNRSLFS